MTHDNDESAVTLPGAGTPADQGLSALGMLMQLAGSVFAAMLAVGTLPVLLNPSMRDSKLWLFLLLATCIGRSLLHRHAGAQLLYGKRTADDLGGPLAALHKYILVGLLHAAFIAAVMMVKFKVATAYGVGMGIALAMWPAALAVLLRLPRFQRLQSELPVPEDKGFEGASILMVVFGTCGVLGSGAALLLLLEAGNALLLHGFGILLFGATGMLVIRSILHVMAGLSGLRETSVDRAVEQANRYANFGVISSFCVGAAFLLMMMRVAFHPAALAMVACICWMLLAWPLIIRRFFSERQFADLLAGDQADLHRRAPDAGLTTLGWLLFGLGIVGAAVLVPELIAGSSAGNEVREFFGAFGPVQTQSVWWSVLSLGLQLWAGLELIRMSPTSKVIATIYGLAAIAVALYSISPLLDGLEQLNLAGGPQSAALFAPVAIQLVVPVATLLLVHRKITPMATARFRAKPPEA